MVVVFRVREKVWSGGGRSGTVVSLEPGCYKGETGLASPPSSLGPRVSFLCLPFVSYPLFSSFLASLCPFLFCFVWLGVLLGCPEHLLVFSWGPLGLSWGALGVSWVPPEVLVGTSWGHLGNFGVVEGALGPLGVLLRPCGVVRGPFDILLGCSWELLGCPWGFLGASGGALGSLSGLLVAFQGAGKEGNKQKQRKPQKRKKTQAKNEPKRDTRRAKLRRERTKSPKKQRR